MDIITYFDQHAQHWDDDYRPGLPERTAAALFAGVEGARVLDVACGTGVMFPELLAQGAAQITGVDISPNMAALAAEKYADNDKVHILCGDVVSLELEGFDAVLIYNAYPHFMNKPALIAAMARALKPGGRLTVAHGAGRELINAHHANVPPTVTSPLLPAKQEAAVWEGLFSVDCLVDTPFIYVISGVKL